MHNANSIPIILISLTNKNVALIFCRLLLLKARINMHETSKSWAGFLSFFLTMPAKITNKILWLVLPQAIASLSSNVFREVSQRKVDFLQTWVLIKQIVSTRVKTLRNTNLVASRHIKRGKISLLVDARCSKTLLLKVPNIFFFITLQKHHSVWVKALSNNFSTEFT